MKVCDPVITCDEELTTEDSSMAPEEIMFSPFQVINLPCLSGYRSHGGKCQRVL